MAGLVGISAMAGLVEWLAMWGGWPGDRRTVDLLSKECS